MTWQWVVLILGVLGAFEGGKGWANLLNTRMEITRLLGNLSETSPTDHSKNGHS